MNPQRKNRIVKKIPAIFKDSDLFENVLFKTGQEMRYLYEKGIDIDYMDVENTGIMMYLIADEKINDLILKKSAPLKTLSKRLVESIKFNLQNQYAFSDKDEMEILKIVCEQLDETHLMKLMARVLVSAYFRQELVDTINAKR